MNQILETKNSREQAIADGRMRSRGDKSAVADKENIPPNPLIKALGLTVFYGNKPAFTDVDMTVFPKQITALIGPSGCGKTSFLNCLNRLTDLIPNCRISGDVRIGSGSIHDRAVDVVKLRRRVGMIFQRPNPFPISIRKNLDLPLREYGIGEAVQREEIIYKTFKDVGLWDEIEGRLDSSALALSGGQQQRLCIARTLALKPEIILFDEPCSSLDPISSGVVEDLIVRLSRNYTVVIVTHNLAQARRIADFVGFFWITNGSGSLIEFGRSDQVFRNPKNELTKAYINGSKG